jgi:hypothetical protein
MKLERQIKAELLEQSTKIVFILVGALAVSVLLNSPFPQSCASGAGVAPRR